MTDIGAEGFTAVDTTRNASRTSWGALRQIPSNSRTFALGIAKTIRMHPCRMNRTSMSAGGLFTRPATTAFVDNSKSHLSLSPQSSSFPLIFIDTNPSSPCGERSGISGGLPEQWYKIPKTLINEHQLQVPSSAHGIPGVLSVSQWSLSNRDGRFPRWHRRHTVVVFMLSHMPLIFLARKHLQISHDIIQYNCTYLQIPRLERRRADYTQSCWRRQMR